MTIEKLHNLLKETDLPENDIQNILKQVSSEKSAFGLIFEAEETTLERLIEKTTFKVNERTDLSIVNDLKKPKHILLEGDNINSLAYLNHQKEQVDVIYIDPPYNTGNRDFTYNDTFKGTKDEWNHSSWLAFINERLILSRNLLKDDGVIFVSIDDNEQAQLKLLLDKVYGEDCFLGTIIQNKGNAQNDAYSIQKNHEYIHVYTKKNARLYHKKPILKKVIKDENGWYFKGTSITTGGVGGALNRCPTLGYTIYYNPLTKEFIGDADFDLEKARVSNVIEDIYKDNEELINKGYTVKIRPPKRGTKLGCWTWGLDNFNAKRNNILITKVVSSNSYSVIQKKYVDEQKVVVIKGTSYYSDKLPSNSRSILDFPSAGGTNSLTDIFKFKAFNNPKNIDMLKYLISLHTNKDAVVLDFFAGSGSTGQAVLELNKEDGGNRKVILCTNNEVPDDLEKIYLENNNYILKRPTSKRGNENKAWLTSITTFKESARYKDILLNDEYQALGICRSITYERIKNVVNGYTTRKGTDIEGISANLTYLKCEK